MPANCLREFFMRIGNLVIFFGVVYPTILSGYTRSVSVVPLVGMDVGRYNSKLLSIEKVSGEFYMALSTAQKAQIIQTYQKSSNDTGSSEVQIALLTGRINALTEHLKIHKHDFHTRFGLTNLVSQRRRLMRYLKNTNSQSYLQLIKALDIRGLS